MKYTKESILQICEEEDVEFIRMQFTNSQGIMKNIAITSSQLEKALNNEILFDSSSVDGFYQPEAAEMYLYPDLDTFTIFPWRPQQGKVARLICDVMKQDGSPYEGDPRGALKRAIAHAKELGYTFRVGPELEFFLFHTDENALPTTVTHEKAGYFDIAPLDFGENARRDIVLTLEDMGFEIKSSHHEHAPAQHEIDFTEEEALVTADQIMTFKMAVKSVAQRHGLHATFMPKPLNKEAGSGMHLKMALFKDGKNIFTDSNDECRLSKEAYQFISGLLAKIKEITVFANPLVNSYKRLVGGEDAPLNISWSNKRRCPLLRVPFTTEDGSVLELRSPDPSANPYLLLALVLEAGLYGIEHNLAPVEPVNGDLTDLVKGGAYEIDKLPQNLGDALYFAKKSDFDKAVLTEHLVTTYTTMKEREWDEYRSFVTQWEIDNYLGIY